MKLKLLVVFLTLVSVLVLVGCTPGESPITVAISPTPLPVDIDGVAVVDSSLRTVAKDYFVGIAEGDIAGHSGYQIFGYNDAVGTVEEDIFLGSTQYVFPIAAQQMELVSTSAQDDVGGTGISVVTVYYLDNTYASQTEDVTLDGTTPVVTTAVNILRVNDLRAKTVGSTYKAVGTISIRNLADTPVYRYITPLFTTSRGAVFTVPLGKSVYIQDWYVGVGDLNAANNCRLTINANHDMSTGSSLTAGLFFMPHAEVLLPNGNVIREFKVPIKFPATTDVKVSAKSDAGSAFVESSLRGWIENN